MAEFTDLLLDALRSLKLEYLSEYNHGQSDCNKL